MKRTAGMLCVAAVALIGGCRSRTAPESAPAPRPSALPALQTIPVYEIVPAPREGMVTVAPARQRDPLTELGATKPITLNASNANARTLLLEIAREAGVSLVVAPDVSARVSVNFVDVPAGEALRAIIAQAGLSILTGGIRSPWPPAVFYQLPVNIDQASAETIIARFGVSAELAKFLVETRTP